ncbi:hypothetical protein IMCC26134_02070 [Verrucomicrobia bacterium IMCC26134]|nr:hypothetical protein IMCC26134_02070 [Verrucomicrobia bacterium IMCC26134]
MNDDAALLHRYAAEGSQEAFAELVLRHLSLVYHAALRQTGGDPHRAEDVAQRVFTDLARKASALSHHPLLVAWLHTATRHAAAELRRTELRLHAREQAAFAMNDTELAPEPDADWERLRPLIDDALQTLGERDRAAVLLRFFENRSYAEVAATLAVSEDAARVRVNRALEKLRATLARRGLVSTASALGIALAQPALAATPAGLAASITTSSLAAAYATAVGTAVGFATATFMSTVKIAAAIAGALAVLSVGVSLYQHPPATAKIVAATAPALSASDLAALLRPARLAPADAAAALGAYLALPPLAADATQAGFLERAARLRTLLTILPADHFAQLLSATTTRPGDPEARLRSISFTAWSELDAPAAAGWALALVPSGSIDAKARVSYLQTSLTIWAADDFDASYAWAGSIEDPALARDLAVQLLAVIIPVEPSRALALARARGDEFFTGASEALCNAWSKKDPAAAVRTFAVDLYSRRGLQFSSRDAIARWMKTDASTALDWIISLREEHGDIYQDLIPSIFQRLAGNDPTTARPLLDLLVSRPDLPGQRNTLAATVRDWSMRDPQAALSWLKNRPADEARTEMVSWTIELLSFRLSPDFFTALELLPEGQSRNNWIGDYANNLARTDPDSALAWLAAHAAPDVAAAFAPKVKNTIIARLAGIDPTAAARQLTAEMASRAPNSTPADHLFAVQNVGTRLSRQDPEALMHWAESIPDPDLRLTAYQSLAQDLDIETVGINIPTAITHARRADLLATIADAKTRENALGMLLGNWLECDYPSARDWIERHDALSPDAAAKILTAKDPARYKIDPVSRELPFGF